MSKVFIIEVDPAKKEQNAATYDDKKYCWIQ